MFRSLSIAVLAAALLFPVHASVASAQSASATAPHASTRLSRAERRLAREETERVRAELRARRRLNLARFQAYVDRGIYPQNSYSLGPRNVFIDENGSICAAATIMMQDGLEGLVRTLATVENFLALGTVTDGPVMEWILGSGFTQEEIVAIQAPFVGDSDDMLPNARQAEHARLAARYAQVLRSLHRNERASLATAAARKIEHDHAASASSARGGAA